MNTAGIISAAILAGSKCGPIKCYVLVDDDLLPVTATEVVTVDGEDVWVLHYD